MARRDPRTDNVELQAVTLACYGFEHFNPTQAGPYVAAVWYRRCGGPHHSMPDPKEPARRSPDDRQRPLIAPVPLDAVIAANDRWTKIDRELTSVQRGLDKGITQLREDLQAAGQAPDEAAGPAVETPAAAAAALDASRSALAQALEARARGVAELEAAHAAVEKLQNQVADVRTARRAIVVIVLLLGWGLFGMVFG